MILNMRSWSKFTALMSPLHVEHSPASVAPCVEIGFATRRMHAESQYGLPSDVRNAEVQRRDPYSNCDRHASVNILQVYLSLADSGLMPPEIDFPSRT